MTREISDVLRIMRLAIGRRNANDPDSSDTTLLGYINDFMSLSMSDDIKIMDQFKSFEFVIDQTTLTGSFAFPGPETSTQFVNITPEVMISETAPLTRSVSWYSLELFQDPGEFFAYWGFNNTAILVRGAPTQVLYYDSAFTFRTLPNKSYTIKMFGYASVPDGDVDPDTVPDIVLPRDYWMRYVAYGAAKQYAADYRLDPQAVANIDKNYARERQLVLTRTHNQAKTQRCVPRF